MPIRTAATLVAGTVAALALGLAPAAAQSRSGDTAIAYQGGIVYDDDLVPGRGTNAPYLVEEQSGGAGADAAYGSATAAQRASEGRRISSPNLIGPDGRAIRN